MPAYLYRSAGTDLIAPDRASAVAILTAYGSSYEGQVRIVVDGKTVGRMAWVGSAIEDLSGYERSDGGYGVVASVDGPNQVTLAAGYTLGAAGRCRLWDVTGTTHLDGGGVEWRRTAAVVTLPDTTGLAAGDVVYSDRLQFTRWAQLSACLTALGISFDGSAELVNQSTGLTIGRWAYVSGAISPIGAVRFDRVSASKYGLVAAVVDGTTATLTSGHTMPAAGVAYVWDTSAGAAIGTAVAFTVAGDTMTVADTTGWAAGDQVWIADTELCVGTGCAVVPGAGGAAYFAASALHWPVQTAISTLPVVGPWVGVVVGIKGGSLSVGAGAGSAVVVGRTQGATYTRGGYLRDGATVELGYLRDTTNSSNTAINQALETRLDVIVSGIVSAQGTQSASHSGPLVSSTAGTPGAQPLDIQLVASSVALTSLIVR